MQFFARLQMALVTSLRLCEIHGCETEDRLATSVWKSPLAKKRRALVTCKPLERLHVSLQASPEQDVILPPNSKLTVLAGDNVILKYGPENVTRHYAVSVAFQSSSFCCHVRPRLHCHTADPLAVLLPIFQLLTVILNLGQGVRPPNLGSITQEIPNLGQFCKGLIPILR